MPGFKLHEKWAEKLGIDHFIAREVNKYIDLGGKHDWYKDWGLIDSGLQTLCVTYGKEGVKAAFLHAILDFLADKLLLKEEIIFAIPHVPRHLAEDFYVVREFVKQNLNEITEEIRNDPKFQKRLKGAIDFSEISYRSFDISGTLISEEGKKINSVAAFQKIASFIKRGGRCRITFCQEKKEFTLTRLEDLENLLYELRGKKIIGRYIQASDKEIFIII